MRSRLPILVDCDGVLADFATPALDIIRKLGGPRLKPSEITAWDMGSLLSDERDEDGCSPRASFHASIGQYGWCSALKPFPDAADVIEELRRIGNVVCVTAPFEHSDTWPSERLRWLKKHFGFDKKHVVQTNNKVWVPGQALADDGVHNLQDWGLDGGYLVARSYNHDNAGFMRGPFSGFVEYAERRVREHQLKASLA